MRLFNRREEMKLNPTGCIVVPASLFIALMIATAGFAIWPKLAAPGAAIVCGGGEVVHEAHEYRRPGEYMLMRQILCQSGSGKEATREEITLPAMAVSFLIYAIVLFLLLQFAVRPLVARRLRRRMEALGLSGGAGRPGGPQARGGLDDLLARVQEAAQRGEAEGRNHSVDEADGGDIAARLARLKSLRDRGLITAQDYETKKAEILAEL